VKSKILMPFGRVFGTLVWFRGTPRRGKIALTRIRAGLIVLLLAAFLASGAQVAFAVVDPADQSAAGTTGAQQSTSCPTPQMSGLPKRTKVTNAKIHFKLTNMTVGASYLIRAGSGEVTAGAASESTVRSSFLLPDQGVKDKKIFITAVVYSERCDNAPWKLQKKIGYKSTTPATPATPPATPAAPATPAVPATPAKPAGANPGARAPNTPKPAKLPKVKTPKPIPQQLPQSGPPPSRRTWLTPLDGGARLDHKLSGPELGRLERKVEKASSTHALWGLGIVAVLLAAGTLGGFMAFRRRDEVEFERAQTEQLKHLEEGDPGTGFSEDPDAPLAPAEQAPFAEDPEPPATEPLVPAASASSAAAQQAVGQEELERHRKEVEAELERILTEAGIEAELEGILLDARAEAERFGIELDPDLMLQALCEEINGSAKLSDTKRDELRAMFAGILAEEAQHAPPAAETVPTQ
jgi:hypothetical protein